MNGRAHGLLALHLVKWRHLKRYREKEGVQVVSINSLLSEEQRAQCRAPIDKARTLPNVAFTSEVFYQVEVEKIFSANWVALDFVQMVPDNGDVLRVELAGMPLLMVRNHQGELKVFHNIVPYDGCLAVTDPQKEVSEIRTPYHGWKYDLDGKLTDISVWNGSYDGKDLSAVGERPRDLAEVPTAIWGPVVFVNLNGQAESFSEHIAPFHRIFENWDIEDLDIGRDEHSAPLLDPEDLATNWKTHYENWGINVLHESFVHSVYDASKEVPRLTQDGKKTCVDYIEGRFMALNYNDKDFQNTYPEFPFPDLSRSELKQADQGYFGSLFPNLHVGVWRTLIHLIISLPDGPGRTRTQRAQFYRTQAASDLAHLEARLATVTELNTAGSEDGRITQSVQKARRSPAFQSRYYSQFWDEMHYQFTQIVLNDLER